MAINKSLIYCKTIGIAYYHRNTISTSDINNETKPVMNDFSYLNCSLLTRLAIPLLSLSLKML